MGFSKEEKRLLIQPLTQTYLSNSAYKNAKNPKKSIFLYALNTHNCLLSRHGIQFPNRKSSKIK